MQEHQLYELWQFYAASGKTIQSNSHSLKVIHPGFLNTARGPDFRSARFVLDGVLQQGDVECHICRRDWYRHHHHLDAAFANVLLHVVSQQEKNNSRVIHAQADGRIPTISLPSLNDELPVSECRLEKQDVPALISLGRQQFQFKSRQFTSLLQVSTPQHTLYEYYLRALGYSANSTAFQHLAANLPWSWLVNQLHNGISQLSLLALYAGQAGFLPPKTHDPYIKKLIHYYAHQQNLLDNTALDPTVWQTAGVRPFNHPHFRMAGWVALLFTHSLSPFTFLYELLSQRLSFQTSYKKLHAFFRIPCNDYWVHHVSFGKLRSGKKVRYFLGPARITEILCNLVFPLFHSQAIQSNSNGFAAYLEEFYLWLPAVSGYGYITKQFSSLFSKSDKMQFHAIAQGLHFLKKYFCTLQKCNTCPFNYKKH